MTDELRKSIIVDASPAVVFRALTDERELVAWLPNEAKMDVRVGGAFEFKYHWEERKMDSTVRGQILELIPERKLSCSWSAERSDRSQEQDSGSRSSIVTWMLDPMPDGKTRVTMVHSNIAKEYCRIPRMAGTISLGDLSYCKR